MSGGLLALLDDIATLAKTAAVTVDDIAAAAARAGAKTATTVLDDAAKAGSKAAAVVVDDAAVTPKYVTQLPAARELPIIWRIARASVRNKLLILLPAALLLSLFAPWLITPLLMLGGCYLAFEGAEKVLHVLDPHEEGPKPKESLDAAHLEEQRVAGAIKTDFILSAEIMTIALAAIPPSALWQTALSLALVAVGITALVYGSVALIVKADDVGLRMAAVPDGAALARMRRAVGTGLVKGMPGFMTALSTVGTVAMLWVGGSILVHGLHDLGWHAPQEAIEAAAHAAGGGVAGWLVTALLDALAGLLVGLALVPLVNRVVLPIAARLR